MTSPLGHSLGAYIANAGRCPRLPVDQPLMGRHLFSRPVVVSVLLLIFAGNAPDLDFLWGAWMGDMNTYHHCPSHSITAIFIFSALLWWLLPLLKLPRYQAFTGGLAYGSHLLLDWFTTDRTLPYGMQLYWPFDDRYVLASKAYFINIDHGDMGSTVLDALPAIFSAHNLGAMGLELLVLGPTALFVLFLRRRRGQLDVIRVSQAG